MDDEAGPFEQANQVPPSMGLGLDIGDEENSTNFQLDIDANAPEALDET